MTFRIDQDALASSIQAIIAKVLQIDVRELVPDMRLKDQGLDSLHLLFLIDALESAFHIKLIGAHLEVDDFRSVDSIATLLNQTHQPGGN